MVFTDQGGKPEAGTTSSFKTGGLSKPRRVRRQRREPPFTERQLELLKARTCSYYYPRHYGPTKLSWQGLCNDIFELTKVRIKREDLRQWATDFIEKRRRTSRHPTDAGFVALAQFMMDPEIDMLSAEELNEPEIPHRFGAFLLEFLKHPGHDQLFPPEELHGTYRARLKADDGTIRRTVELAFDVRKGNHVIRISEKSYLGDVEPADYHGSPKKALFDAIYRAAGCGVVTPEGNIILFMKKEPYGYAHYYFSMAVYPDFSPESCPSQLALLRHETPAPPPYPPPNNPDTRTLEDLMRETDEGTVLLHFSKTADPA